MPSSKYHDRPSIFPFVFLALLSGVAVFSYNAVLDRVGDGRSANNMNASPALYAAGVRGGGSGPSLWFEHAVPGGRKLNSLKEQRLIDRRIAELIKTAWPECIDQQMTIYVCKAFIDEYIQLNFEGQDKYIRVIVKEKRAAEDEWYNTIVITMNDMDMSVGLDGDGVIEYPFVWEGSGEVATAEQEAEIPPVFAYETLAGTPGVIEEVSGSGTASGSATPAPGPTPIDPLNPDDPLNPAPASTPAPGTTPTLDPELALMADPEAEEYEPLIFEEEPTLVEGATLDAYILGDATDLPIAGGVVTDPSTESTAEGQAKLDPLLESYLADGTTAEAPLGGAEAPLDGAEAPLGGAEAPLDGATAPSPTTTTTSGVTVAEAGPRTLPAFDCTGLTGADCCLMIKLLVRDSDEYGNAIQCQLVYNDESDKGSYINARGKKVFVWDDGKGRVRKTPKIVGSWPQGGDSFSGWLEDGGNPAGDPAREDWIPDTALAG